MQILIVALMIFLLDQATKHVALQALKLGESVPVIQSVFHLTLVRNEGIAFGYFDHFGIWLVILIAVCIAVLLIYSLRLPGQDVYHRLAYGLVLGGAVGNLMDRVRFGHVVDFLDFRIWPVFNVADTFITIGVSLLILSVMKGSSRVS